MPNHISILIDKSVLQALSPREAKWLFHHFQVNLPPVFFSEVLGDLEKAKDFSTGSAVGDVRTMSAKVDSAFVALNRDSRALIADELIGKRFEMDGRPVLDFEIVRMPKGSLGSYLEQTPMQRVLDRWKSGEFKAMERDFAMVWRKRLASIDLEKVARLARPLCDKDVRTPADVRRVVDDTFFRCDHNFANLSFWLGVVEAPEAVKRSVLEIWKRVGRPPANEFLPYIAHVSKVRLFFTVAVMHRVISTRPSNQIDMEYFDYLPFARIFSSNDKLHADVFPALSGGFHVFMPFSELKAALRELADHYDSMTPEQKAIGSMNYADCPPVEMNNAITRAYDHFMPGWRNGPNGPPPPHDPTADALLMEHLRSIEKAIDAHKAKR